MQIEEAIEYLKKRNENYKSHKEEIDSVGSVIYGINNVKEYHKKQESIDAVLNHIERIEAETKNVVSRKKYRQTKKTLKGQIRKLNAVIDEMAEYFNCGLAMCDDCEYSCSEKCSACIKEYFYKKVR